MHFFTAIVTALIAGAHLIEASPAPVPAEAVTNSTQTPSAAAFGINLGSTFNNNVAWVDGQSKCNNVPITAINTNPCGHAFSLNGLSFTVNGCGTSSLWITTGSSNTFWANYTEITAPNTGSSSFESVTAVQFTGLTRAVTALATQVQILSSSTLPVLTQTPFPDSESTQSVPPHYMPPIPTNPIAIVSPSLRALFPEVDAAYIGAITDHAFWPHELYKLDNHRATRDYKTVSSVLNPLIAYLFFLPTAGAHRTTAIRWSHLSSIHQKIAAEYE
ncbi:hypothetical protein CVT25_006623 [Psilocybe cyanescens]|uniref:Uncharacterized protein n=1 Tax=Psilocybe cyanescens TaxID=93625 RepID=A0A409XIR3_PSICY|nr:hypothetical protein CVT25_006623 [Psilocybe cyanescens]